MSIKIHRRLQPEITNWFSEYYHCISFNIIYIMRTSIESDRIRRLWASLAWLLMASESTFLTADTITLAISLLDFPPGLHWKKFPVVWNAVWILAPRWHDDIEDYDFYLAQKLISRKRFLAYGERIGDIVF